MKRLSWKYIAGLIDGEGCLDVQVCKDIYVRPRVRVCLTESSLFILEMLHANHGGHLYYRPGKGEWAGSWSWELCGYRDVCMFLRNIVNHLYIKREQARFLLWMETNLKGRNIVYPRVREIVRDELGAMKRDPHRLSEEAQRKVLNELNRCEAIVGTSI